MGCVVTPWCLEAENGGWEWEIIDSGCKLLRLCFRFLLYSRWYARYFPLSLMGIFAQPLQALLAFLRDSVHQAPRPASTLLNQIPSQVSLQANVDISQTRARYKMTRPQTSRCDPAGRREPLTLSFQGCEDRDFPLIARSAIRYRHDAALLFSDATGWRDGS